MSRRTVAEKFQNEGYDISITGRHVLVTDAMKDYALEKLSKIDRLGNRIIDIDVVMDIQKLVHRIDIVMKVDHILIRSSASSENMYASIDKATHRLQQQLLRYKDRIQKYHARNPAGFDVDVNIVQGSGDHLLEEINEEIEAKNSADMLAAYQPHKIVSKEVMHLKRLSYDEAIMKMELSGDAFMVFQGEDQKLKVIYRREDGNFGIMEPEK